MKTKDLTLAAMMTAFLIVCSLLPAIPISGLAPITLQTVAVLIIGFVLKPYVALLSTTLYAVMGFAGLPVFSGGKGGFGPGSGFILSFIVAAFATSVFLKRTSRQLWHYIVAAILATFIIYAIGSPFYAVMANLPIVETTLSMVATYIIGDSLKAILAIAVAMRIPHNKA
ncbi:MAG: biotin transporter BioY [Aerococcaceae bacterium]|nr:biotin transporter BioY [Aerococcaceae bacterium]